MTKINMSVSCFHSFDHRRITLFIGYCPLLLQRWVFIYSVVFAGENRTATPQSQFDRIPHLVLQLHIFMLQVSINCGFVRNQFLSHGCFMFCSKVHGSKVHSNKRVNRIVLSIFVCEWVSVCCHFSGAFEAFDSNYAGKFDCLAKHLISLMASRWLVGCFTFFC